MYEYYDEPFKDDVFIDWFDMVNFAGTPQDIDYMKKFSVVIVRMKVLN